MDKIEEAIQRAFANSGKNPQVKRARRIREAYKKRFGIQDYSTEEHQLTPEQMYAQMEICLKEGKPFRHYYPLDPDPNILY